LNKSDIGVHGCLLMCPIWAVKNTNLSHNDNNYLNYSNYH
jgi:hypothetical protein